VNYFPISADCVAEKMSRGFKLEVARRFCYNKQDWVQRSRHIVVNPDKSIRLTFDENQKAAVEKDKNPNNHGSMARIARILKARYPGDIIN